MQDHFPAQKQTLDSGPVNCERSLLCEAAQVMVMLRQLREPCPPSLLRPVSRPTPGFRRTTLHSLLVLALSSGA